MSKKNKRYMFTVIHYNRMQGRCQTFVHWRLIFSDLKLKLKNT